MQEDKEKFKLDEYPSIFASSILTIKGKKSI